jgi:hypothetical protein
MVSKCFATAAVLTPLICWATVPVLGNNLRKQDKQVPGKEKSDDGGCGETLAEDRDERRLGYAAVLYSHFLPRFITTWMVACAVIFGPASKTQG